jgi:hypothetical protein
VAGSVIIFDFDDNTLGGVALGDDDAALHALGPPEGGAAEGAFFYCSRGFWAESLAGVIVSFTLIWNTASYPKFKPFGGDCRYRGAGLSLGKDTSEDELLSVFGMPTQRLEDEDEILLVYRFDGVEWQLELSLKRKLVAITIDQE